MKKITLLFFFILLSLPLSSISYADQTVAVSAVISPHPSDFQLAISSSPSSGTTVHQLQTINYTITYGSHLFYTTPVTIVGSWDKGTIQGQSSPSVDISDYVINSATNGYNNSPPIVDTTNRIITWTIASLPANTINQTVSFSLQTNASFTGTQTVTFPITAHMSVNNVTIPDQTTTTTYQYNPGITPSPVPSFTPTPIESGPTPIQSQPTVFPTYISLPSTIPTQPPTNIPSTLLFQTVTITALSSTNAVITATTNRETVISLQYGTTLLTMHKTESDQLMGIEHILSLSELQPNTTYYYRLLAKTQDGTSISSDIFTFTTPLDSTMPQINKTSLIVTSERILLFDPIEDQSAEPSVVIPINTPYEFTFSLAQDISAKYIEVYIKNNQVLGINTFDETDLPTDNLTLFEPQQGVYQGRLQSPSHEGNYQLIAHIVGTNGTISEVKIADIKVVKQFTLYDKKSHKPIESAHIQISRWNEHSKLFSAITPQMLAIENPLLSDAQGKINVVLPNGTYKASITAPGYTDAVVTFTIDPYRGNGYPTVYMEGSVLSVGGIITVVTSTVSYCVSITKPFINQLFVSHQLYQLLSFIIIGITVILSIFSLSIRIAISPFLFPWYIWYITSRIFKGNTTNEISGKIIDETTKHHISHAEVILIDADKNAIVGKTLTNALGEFSFNPAVIIARNDGTSELKFYHISVNKHGYEQHPFFEYSTESIGLGKLVLEIKKEEAQENLQTFFAHEIKQFLGFLFEVLLLLTIILEVLYGWYLGFHVVIFFLAVSCINVLVWLLDTAYIKK